MTCHTLARSRLDAAQNEGPGPSYLHRRLARAPEQELTALRRRRNVATCLACLAGAGAFFGLYALSWVLVLDL